LITIYSYPGPYSQIITNLILNTIYHAFDKGEKGNVNIEIRQNNSKIMIKFTDDGKGIDSANLSKIFNPFFTTNREHGGSGLGLNIIYNIVKSIFKGTIKCTSSVGKGTEFNIVLFV